MWIRDKNKNEEGGGGGEGGEEGGRSSLCFSLHLPAQSVLPIKKAKTAVEPTVVQPSAEELALISWSTMRQPALIAPSMSVPSEKPGD